MARLQHDLLQDVNPDLSAFFQPVEISLTRVCSHAAFWSRLNTTNMLFVWFEWLLSLKACPLICVVTKGNTKRNKCGHSGKRWDLEIISTTVPNLSQTVFVLVKEKYIKNKIKWQMFPFCCSLCFTTDVRFYQTCARLFCFLMTWAYEELKCQFFLSNGIKMTFIMSLHSERFPGSNNKE